MPKRKQSANAQRLGSTFVAMILLGTLGSCGNNAEVTRSQADATRLRAELKQERGEIQKLKARLAKMERSLLGLEARLTPHLQRSGDKAFSGGSISRASGARLDSRSALVVENADDRAKKRKSADAFSKRSATVIGFWATWCKPCVADEELSHMRQMRERLRVYQSDFINILIDDVDKARNHSKANKWIYPLWFVEDGHMNMLPRSLVQRVGLGLPFFLVVDATGAVRWFHKGKLTDAVVDDLVTAAVKVSAN